MTEIKGLLSAVDEFLYPDSELAILPNSLHLALAMNNYASFQLLIKTEAKELEFSLDSQDFELECYQMQPIPVEYNTGDGENQGGAMVLMDRPKEKPAYATRLAPFYVYDCLQACLDGKIANESEQQGNWQSGNAKVAAYFCLKAKLGCQAGNYQVKFKAKAADVNYELRLDISLYNVTVPKDTFNFTNWISEPAIARMHKVKQNSQDYFIVLDKYAEAMARLHQNTIYVQFDERCVQDKKSMIFSFEHLTPVIETFFKRGLKYLELGVLLDRGFLESGMPDMYTANFKCALAKDMDFDSLAGYKFTVRFVQSLAKYLQKHAWTNNIFFHVHDEPDIHYKDDATLESRRRQYYQAVAILRKYLPNVKIIEAVDSPKFRGGIDVWVPGTAGYEKQKAEFDELISLGETVWAYVCCGPEGFWLNRFLDCPLIKNRLLFWGCAKNRLGGFLHWGLNQFPENMDPFKATSCPNHTGIGTNFPCGDAFIVYPNEDRLNIGMRFESERRGAEDVALFQMLYKKDQATFYKLLDQAFTNNYTYESDPYKLANLYEQLLASLEELG